MYAAGKDTLDGLCRVSSGGGLLLDSLAIGSIALVRKRDEDEHFAGRRNPLPLLWMPDSLIQEGIDHGSDTLSAYLKYDEEPPQPNCSTSRYQEYWRTLMMDCKRYPAQRLRQEGINKLQSLFDD